MPALIECVPNFSEGRDPDVIRQITGRITAAGGPELNGTPRALIVVPTRELCLQVYDDLKGASKYLAAQGDRKLTVVSI